MAAEGESVTSAAREGIEALLLRDYRTIVDVARRKWRLDEEEALDLVHETVVRVYESFNSFDPGRGDLKAWMWGILRHVSARRPEGPVPPPPTPGEPTLPGALIAGEVLGFVRESVAALPEAYRRTVELRFYEGLELRDIARQLGVPIGTVKARLSRAPEILRQSLRVQATTAAICLDEMRRSRK